MSRAMKDVGATRVDVSNAASSPGAWAVQHTQVTPARAALLLLLVGLSVAHVLAPDAWVRTSTYLVVTVGASVVAWLGAHRAPTSVRVWLAIGITASALGDLCYEIYVAVRHTVPDVSIADPPWIASYVGVGVALLVALRRGGNGPRRDVDGFIDMMVIGLAAILVIWQFLLIDTLTDASVAPFVRAVWASYPILDAVLLVLVIRTFVERQTMTKLAVLVAGGVLLWLICDFLFLIGIQDGLFGHLADVGWMLGAASLAAGCWYAPMRDAALTDVEEPPQYVGKGRIALAVAPLLIPACIELIAYYEGRDANPIPLLLGTAGFVGLAGARAMRLVALRDRAQTRLASSERLYRALAANSSDAVMILDADGRITNDAPAMAAMVGHPGATTRGSRALDFISDGDAEPKHLFDQTLLSPGEVLAGEVRLPRADSGDLWLSTRAVNLLADPDVHGIVVNVHDITGRKQAEEELVHQAFHDALTGLANRALFRDRVEHALTRSARTGMDPAVIYLDLDGFKNVNDGLGHEAGDNLLREIGERLEEVVRSGDTVARLGGDEFALLIDESRNVRVEAEEIAERALRSIMTPVSVGDHELTLTASLGIAYADSMSTASSLLRDADVAMYQAKTNGKARWVVYEPTTRASTVERLRLENDLVHAIENRQLRLVYQPVIELTSHRVFGFEALLRWDHPEFGTVMPERFIPIAEEDGMITTIGEWVLRQACATTAQWGTQFPHLSLTMAVNLSARQLTSPDLAEQVRSALEAVHLDPAKLILEMTETALVDDPAAAAAKLGQLRELGVHLAIDDFGTGYSSLTYLRQFPVDILKIDRSFISTITDSAKMPAIVRGLMGLARTLHLETVAEGIETEAQVEQLRKQHCRFGQGYYFAKPLDVTEAEELLGAIAVPAPRRHPLAIGH